jgi:hypothetical protein
MRGLEEAVNILLIIGVGILGLLVAFIILAPLISVPSSSSLGNYQYSLTRAFFDYTPYILNLKVSKESSQSYVESTEFCSRLKTCIINSWQTGESCQVGDVVLGKEINLYSPLKGVTGDNEQLIPFGYGCDTEYLWYAPVVGMEARVCKYNQITNREIKRYGSQAGLTYEDCEILDGSDDVLYPTETDRKTMTADEFTDWASSRQDSIDELKSTLMPYKDYPIYPAGSKADVPYVHFNVDRLYSNNTTGSEDDPLYRYNGAGRYRFVIDGAYVDDSGDCRYHLLLCPKPSIATSSSDPILTLFDTMKDLPAHHLSEIPYYVSDLSSKANRMVSTDYAYIPNQGNQNNQGGQSGQGGTYIPLGKLFDYYNNLGPDLYYFSEREIDLGSGSYRIVQIANAIKAGFDAKGSEMLWASPYWEIHQDYGKLLSNYLTPWNTAFDRTLESSDAANRTREMYINCGSDGICSKTIKVKMALRIDPETGDKNWRSIIIAVMEKP